MVELESVKSAVPTKEIIAPKLQHRYPSLIQGRANVVDWIQKVNGLTRTYNWPDRTEAHFALMRLDGVATTWYSSQSEPI